MLTVWPASNSFDAGCSKSKGAFSLLMRMLGTIVVLWVVLAVGQTVTAGDGTDSPLHHAHHQLDSAEASSESSAAGFEPSGSARHSQHADQASHCWAYASCSAVALPGSWDLTGSYIGLVWPVDEVADLFSVTFQPVDPPPRS